VGIASQRSNTSTRIRHAAVDAIYDCRATKMRTPADRRKFRKEIGWYEHEDGEEGEYSSLDVPILHEDGSEYDIHTCFLNPVLMRVSLLFVPKMFTNGSVSSTSRSFWDAFSGLGWLDLSDSPTWRSPEGQ
jgi:hypothetical protein